MTTASDIAGAWASDATTALAEGIKPWHVPAYGSPAWLRLRPDAPQRAAALIEAAEQWRRHLAEQQRLDQLADADPIAWYREVTADAYAAARTIARLLAEQKTDAELQKERAKQQPREVTATEGWPPVAIPGRPGWHRHYIDGKQTDLPARTLQETRA